jgi:hypothetical protein
MNGFSNWDREKDKNQKYEFLGKFIKFPYKIPSRGDASRG